MIKEEYLIKMKSDSVLRAKIMIITGKSDSTVSRWIRTKDEALSQRNIVYAICEHLNVSEYELFELVYPNQSTDISTKLSISQVNN